MSYQLLDHTADLRVLVFGINRSDLFKNAGLALFDLIFQPGPGKPLDVVDLEVVGGDPTDLLINFLRELLYLWVGTGLRVLQIEIDTLSDTSVTAHVATTPYQQQHHEIIQEIKAVTYHQADVVRTEKGWQATIVFDI